MHNVHNGKWMVKTSGVPDKVLKSPNGQFDLETIKSVYNPNNRVIITNAKAVSVRNEFWQVVIRDTDFKFVFGDPKQTPTHVLTNGQLSVYGG